jgi:hypothetical protein
MGQDAQINFLNILALEDGTIRCSEMSVTNLIMLLNSPKSEYLNYTAAKPEIFTLSFVNPPLKPTGTHRYLAKYVPIRYSGEEKDTSITFTM